MKIELEGIFCPLAKANFRSLLLLATIQNVSPSIAMRSVSILYIVSFSSTKFLISFWDEL